MLESSKAARSGKHQPLSSMGQPRGGGNVKAQEVMVTVPTTLSVSSATSFSVHEMISSIPVELLVDMVRQFPR